MTGVVNVFMHHLDSVLCLFVALYRGILEQLMVVMAVMAIVSWRWRQLAYSYAQTCAHIPSVTVRNRP